MPAAPRDPALQVLRTGSLASIARGQAPRTILPFGLPAIDAWLPEGGLVGGALHEVAGGGGSAVNAACATLFAAGIMARSPGHILWCATQSDLFAPALAQAGLDPDRVIYATADDDSALLACFEEGLRHGGLGGVVAEVARLSMIASRRLQLAAESTGTMAIALRRWRHAASALDFGRPTAAVTRWRVSALPSATLPVREVGPARWCIELIRNRAGECTNFVMEACDATGHLCLPSDLAYRSLTPACDPSGTGKRTAA